MAKHIVFHHRDKNWTEYGPTLLRGVILSGDRRLSPADLDAMLSEAMRTGTWASTFGDLNGFYSFVRRDEGDIVLGVDRIRGFPLFFAIYDRGILCSDDPFWIQDQLGDYTLDEVAKKEFQLSGYVTRDRTLSPLIKQIRAGEIVRLSIGSADEVNSDVFPYQKYKPGDYVERDLEASLAELDRVMVRSFQRMIEEANGRTIVVPLSGGYDSRVTVLLLKMLGYQNVLTFSYGRQGNEEAVISKEIAGLLDMPWEFVEYTNDDWSRWYRSKENWDYYPMGSGLSSLPILQDWPAVMVLKERGLIPDDAIFAPGHTIANPSQYANLQRHSVKGAEQLPRFKLATTKGVKDVEVGFPVDKLINDLIADNYKLSGRPIKDRVTLTEMRGLVQAALDHSRVHDDYVSLYEYWNFNERQAKFINNSVRVYEFWGYQWWLPLLDKELMDFWRTTSIEQRYDKYLIRVYTDRLSAALMKKFQITEARKKELHPVTSALAKSKTLYRFMNWYYYRKKKANAYDSHPQAYFGMMTWERYDREYTGREYINHFTATDYLDWVSKRSKGP